MSSLFNQQDRKNSLRLLKYFSPYWLWGVFSIVFFFCFSATQVLFADLIQFSLDYISGELDNQTGIIARWGYEWNNKHVSIPILLMSLILFRGFSYFVSNYSMQYIIGSISRDLRCDVVNHMLVVPISFLYKRSGGMLTSDLIFKIMQMTQLLSKGVIIFLREGFSLLALVGYLFYINWKISLFLFFVFPPVFFVIRKALIKIRRYSYRQLKSVNNIGRISDEVVRGFKEIRIFAAEEKEGKHFLDISNDFLHQSLKISLIESALQPIVQVFLGLTLAALFWVMLSPDFNLDMTAGQFVAYFTTAGLLYRPVKLLSSLGSLFQKSLVSANSVFGLLEIKKEKNEGKYTAERAAGKVEFLNVSFSYNDNKEVLSDISFSAAPNQIVALVGRTGSGKTTIFNLLSRFYFPTKGKILLDGVDLNDYELKNLRKQMAVVPQHPVLFDDTIYNNIAYGKAEINGSSASKEEVLRAADAAYVTPFAKEMEKGLDTRIGIGGEVVLSGGQIQRVAIARAMLKDAPILLLDEVTAPLDYETERKISQALNNLMKNRVIFIIAHRLNTVQTANLILVLKNGKIVESGTHVDLIEKQGAYAALYQKKFNE